MKNEDAVLLRDGAAELGIHLTGEKTKLFGLYLQELNTWRKRMNLVRRGSDREIILKDFLDSLIILKHLPPEASLADLGSGGGFPGVPAKIVRSDLEVCLLDSAQKKVFFLKNLLRVLGLTGIEARRASQRDEPGSDAGEFDFLVTRAFGSLEEIAGAGAPLLKTGGILLAMKGKKGEAELSQSLPFLEENGWKKAFTERVLLPFLGHERILIGLQKMDVPRGTP
jgi:16S rRNA (guanine527-N7)-methyltransferase